MEKQLKEFIAQLYKLKFNYLFYDCAEIEFFKNCIFNKFGTVNSEGSLKSDNYFAEILIKYLDEMGYKSGNYILIKQLLEIDCLLQKEHISSDGYKINFDKRKVFKDDKEIFLTTKEFDLLNFIITNKGSVIMREQILKNIWDENYCGNQRIVDDTVRRIRKKMPNIRIQTVYGYGYRFD